MTSLCINIMLFLTIILLAVAIWLDGSHIYLVIPVPNAPRTGPFVSIMRVVSSLIYFYSYYYNTRSEGILLHNKLQ